VTTQYYAQTAIKYGAGDTTLRWEEGDVVDTGFISEDDLPQLIDTGAIADHPPLGNEQAVADALAAKDAEIANLNMRLAREGADTDLQQVIEARDAEIEELRAKLEEATTANNEQATKQAVKNEKEAAKAADKPAAAPPKDDGKPDVSPSDPNKPAT
jgi:ATPase subunit of ABC transporter with duplicated ATPase domains